MVVSSPDLTSRFRFGSCECLRCVYLAGDWGPKEPTPEGQWHRYWQGQALPIGFYCPDCGALLGPCGWALLPDLNAEDTPWPNVVPEAKQHESPRPVAGAEDVRRLLWQRLGEVAEQCEAEAINACCSGDLRAFHDRKSRRDELWRTLGAVNELVGLGCDMTPDWELGPDHTPTSPDTPANREEDSNG